MVLIIIDATMLYGKPFVYISNDQMDAKWGLRIPEWVVCERGGFSFPDLVNSIGSHRSGAYEYEVALRYAWCKQKDVKDSSFGIVAEGLRLRFGIRPNDDRIDLSIELQNISNEAFKGS